ncbi:MAG: hypothetical protein NTZ78_05990 [Candidatus Aureabacteria bacterium]|nr:hypothetical protein [Candidatus Auribacterota bacterium]
MKKIIRLLILCCMLFTYGCTELSQTVSIFNTALGEIFRLPMFCLQLPLQLMQGILQNIGPMMQAGMRSATNMAPLLLFIENRVPRDVLYADSSGGGLEKKVEEAIAAESFSSLLSVLDAETSRSRNVRFILLDARCMDIPLLRKAILSSLMISGGDVRCLRVEAGDLFSQGGRFLNICERMRKHGDVLLVGTPFNEYLASLTGTSAEILPPDPGDRGLLLRWGHALERLESDAHRKG